MIAHQKLGTSHFSRSRVLLGLIKLGEITLAGNINGKIYGKLDCLKGKRMKMTNRIFFKNIAEAIMTGYRPCGSCMPEEYKLWKAQK